MRAMNFRAFRQSLLLLCPLLALAFCVSVYCQDNREYKGLDAVPSSARTRLVERLKLYVKHDRERQYGKLYDLFSKRETERTRNLRRDHPEIISTVDKKEIYIESRKGRLSWARPQPRLLDFVPQRSQEESIGLYAGCYKIRGWARYSKESEERKDGADVLFACFEEGDWYFSTLMEETRENYGSGEAVPVERTEHVGLPNLRPVP
jgi:hypothetical protein